jgi:hypothetical protein
MDIDVRRKRGRHMFGFVIAAVAGFLVPQLETAVAKPVIARLRKVIPIEGNEHRAISILLAMVIASFIASIFDSGSAIGLTIGLILGYFGTRILAVVQNKNGEN